MLYGRRIYFRMEAKMDRVDLSSETFSRLQKHAVPLIDTLETVIARLLDFYEDAERSTQVTSSEAAPKAKMARRRAYGLADMPDLKHTKLLSVQLDDQEIENINWNGLLL